MRHVLRLKHLSIRKAKAYVPWAKRFMLFHHKRYPADMGAAPVRQRMRGLLLARAELQPCESLSLYWGHDALCPGDASVVRSGAA